MSLPLVDVPKYTTELPSTGEVVTFRPFLVKEQKQLLMTVEADAAAQVAVTEDIVAACTWNKLNIKNLAAYDVEYLFMQIRARSVGEKVDLLLTCRHCNHKNPYALDLTTVKVNKPAGHDKNIDLGSGFIIKMLDPDLSNMDYLQRNFNPESVIKLIANSMESIWKNDEMFSAADYSEKERIEFVENLSPVHLAKIEKYFETLPTLKHRIDFECTECKKSDHVELEGLQSFFV